MKAKFVRAALLAVSTVTLLASCTDSGGEVPAPVDPGECKGNFCAKTLPADCSSKPARETVIFSVKGWDKNKQWSYTITQEERSSNGNVATTVKSPRVMPGGNSSFKELFDISGDGTTTLTASGPDGNSLEVVLDLAKDCPPPPSPTS